MLRSVLFAGASLLAFAGAADATVTSYATRGAFDTANPGVATEGFEAANIADSNAVNFTGPLDTTTNNAYFISGSVLAGFSLSTTGADGSPGTNDIYAANNYGGALGKVVSSDLYAENLLISFSTTVNAFAIDLSGFQGVDGPWTITLNSAGGVEGSYSLATGGFFGILSSVAITSVYLDKPDSGGTIDNLSFGVGNAVPEPATWAMLIAGFGLVGAATRRRSMIGQATA